MVVEKSQEILKREFVHFLSNTLALLGAGEDLVLKIRSVENNPLTPQIIEEIRWFNVTQIDNLKQRLDLPYTVKIKVKN